PISVPKTRSVFHPRAKRNAFRRRDVRQQSRSFALYDQRLTRIPKLQPAFLRLSATISQCFTRDRWICSRSWSSCFNCISRLKRGLNESRYHAHWVYQTSLTGSILCRIRALSSGMKPKHILISILAVLFMFPSMGTFAQQAPNSGSIEVITTFDYPGTGNSTIPQKINDRGDIVGSYLPPPPPPPFSRAFVRFRDGSFSALIVEPNDAFGFTDGRGINNSGTVCGNYFGSDGNEHAYFLSGGTFTEYDVPGATNTEVLGIN